MSRYHRLAKQDWTTGDGIAAALRSVLELEGYGTKFLVLRADMPLDEEAARQAIIGEITASPMIEKYQRTLPEVEDRGQAVYVESYMGNLEFEHGDFRQPLSLEGFEVVNGAEEVEKRHKRRTKTQVEKEDREQKLKEKLSDTRNTDKDDYLLHAVQCGYLMRHAAMRFYNKGGDQWGVSMMTSIAGLTLPELRGFIDSAGRESLSGVSTHVDTSLEKAAGPGEPEGGTLTAMHSDFAKEIVDFLNLEYEVDIDDLKRRHARDDSGFRSIGHWIEQSGGDSGMVLEKLKERSSLDPEEIASMFQMGYDSPASGL